MDTSVSWASVSGVALGLAPPLLSSGMQGAESPFTLGFRHGNAPGNAPVTHGNHRKRERSECVYSNKVSVVNVGW